MTAREPALPEYQTFDVVVVPFPFTDRTAQKRRPALVLSAPTFTDDCDHVIAAMVTTTQLRWPSDIALRDAEAAGLVIGSWVRFKIFTLPVDLILRPLGRLSDPDRERVRQGVRSTLPIWD